MKTGRIILLYTATAMLLSFCAGGKGKKLLEEPRESLAIGEGAWFTPETIAIEKELLYDSHTLADTYPYNDTVRAFQWNKIRRGLFVIDSIGRDSASWAILQNYRNKNGESPLVKSYRRNAYKRIADTLGTERWQAIPLFLTDDTVVPERYGRDGALVKLIKESGSFAEVSTVYFSGSWMVPKKYLHMVADTVAFNRAIFVDRTNQNIATLSKLAEKWLIRSMNPATTGLHQPPYAQETPLGIFVIQEKKPRMIFLEDGSEEVGGFAPYACRFTNGGYLHGVPVSAPGSKTIEFSSSLGTTPKSHMCVRTATSHASFIYGWASVDGTLVFVFD